MTSCAEEKSVYDKVPIFQAWTDMSHKGDRIENIAKHQLVFSDTWLFDFGFNSDNLFDYTIDEQELSHARELYEELKQINPDITILAELYYREGIVNEHLESESLYWIRNELGIVPAWGEDLNSDGIMSLDEFETGLIDFTHTDIQQALAAKAKAIEQTGLFDGIMLDWWSENTITATMLNDDKSYLSLEAERTARINILKLIRESVRTDFLILVNSNDDSVPLSAPYINGLYMECYKEEYDKGYSLEQIHKIEETLLWAEISLRTPRINCLEGWRVVSDLEQTKKQTIKERTSTENLRWMRLFTSMSLVLSDGYVLFSDDNALPNADHGHNYYSFWDLDIGKPLETYIKLEEHIYFRQYENAIIVYNGSTENYIFDYNNKGDTIVIEIPALDGYISINN